MEIEHGGLVQVRLAGIMPHYRIGEVTEPELAAMMPASTVHVRQVKVGQSAVFWHRLGKLLPI